MINIVKISPTFFYVFPNIIPTKLCSFFVIRKFFKTSLKMVQFAK